VMVTLKQGKALSVETKAVTWHNIFIMILHCVWKEINYCSQMNVCCASFLYNITHKVQVARIESNKYD